MTATRQWLQDSSKRLRRYIILALAGLVAGLTLTALGLGIALARSGVYLWAPAFVFLGWVAALAVVAWGVVQLRHRLKSSTPSVLAREIEVAGGLRRGSVVGVSERTSSMGRTSLSELADKRASGWLLEAGFEALHPMRSRARRSLGVGGATLLAGAVLFVVAGPAGSRAGQFWSPFHTAVGGWRGPVSVSVDSEEVPFGDSVRVYLDAKGRRSIVLWVREPGEPWGQTEVALDSAGHAELIFGPLESDRFLRAASGRRESSTLHVRVLLPAFLADLQVVARFPAHTGLLEQPLSIGPDSIRLPVGTRIVAHGRATVPVDSVFWSNEGGGVSLATEGDRFFGELPVSKSEHWQLQVFTVDGLIEEDRPQLNLVAVRDSSPIVAIPIPGVDTTIPATKKRALVVDARDDHGLENLELVLWRIDRTGASSDSVVQPLPLPDGRSERAVIQWLLDLSAGDFLPGDTAYFLARALDNAPSPRVGFSDTYRAWLPSRGELRKEVRDMSQTVGEAADSLVEEQRELAREMQDLAAERERSGQSGSSQGSREQDQLPFNSVERARELSDRQEDAVEGTEELREKLQELSDAAWSAGITDPEFHRMLDELQGLLEKALTEDLLSRLRDLQEAIQELDPEAMRKAMRQMAESAGGLQQELARGRELFERAAIEGDMEILAADADDLAARQREWNEDTQREPNDSALAQREQSLAESTEELAAELRGLEEALKRARMEGENTQSPLQRTESAAGDMRNAAGKAAEGSRQEARRSGREASESLDPVGAELRQQREEVQEQWRQEVLDAMDRALVETAELAEGQESALRRLAQGDASADLRGDLAAIRSSVDRLVMRLQGASGRNALVSPQLGAALGFSRLRLTESLDQLQRANPNTRQAEQLAGDALDGLNAVALQLLRNRSDVASSESGSGLSEAMERLAELADQQGQLEGQTDELMSLIPMGTPEVMQQLRELAERQQGVAEELDRLDAQGEVGGAEEMADEAGELAAMLEAAAVDRETVERQEQLFQRLLDAGRSLNSEREDEREERQSRTADPTNVQPPPAEATLPSGGPRFAFPVWEELRSLSPRQRRLVLDYFRRLNSGRP